MKPFRLIQYVFRRNHDSKDKLKSMKRAIRQLRKEAFSWVTSGTPLTDPQPNRPWQPGVRTAPPTMLTPEELTLLYWSASSYYSGAGEIVDGGCFLGGSTAALARGLRDNLKVESKEARIHSFDLFLVDQSTKKRYFADSHLQIGDSFLDTYKGGIRDYDPYVLVYPGDIRKVSWKASIELLFLDVLKLKDINDFALAEFFPNLIPGVSLVIQQDYVHFALPWIHITMERLADYFETLSYCRSGSVVFRLTKPLPAEVLQTGAGTHGSAEEQLALMDSAIEKAPAAAQPILKLAKVMLFSDLFLDCRARNLVLEIQNTYTEPGILRQVQEVKSYLQNPWRQKLTKTD
jgi:hypothetical protein